MCRAGGELIVLGHTTNVWSIAYYGVFVFALCMERCEVKTAVN